LQKNKYKIQVKSKIKIETYNKTGTILIKKKTTQTQCSQLTKANTQLKIKKKHTKHNI